uniref:Uncharacterized protein n=1 Tax=Panagrolaimus sp. PS1159 TaxID=55785 RepID=A0AC35GDZ6_9BILA
MEEDFRFAFLKQRIDVIKPLILYLHSKCFEMPKSFDLDYAERLFKVIDYFELVQENPLSHLDLFTLTIHEGLCKKFVEETWNFNQLLRWVSISFRMTYCILEDMVSTTIAEKYYFKWHETFPDNARNNENQMFRVVFRSQGYNSQTFDEIDSIFNDSLFTKAILN